VTYVDIVFLLKLGWISVTGAGGSITGIQVCVKSLVTTPLKVRISPGTSFVSSGNYQDMVARANYDIDLASAETRHISIAATCLNAGLPVPGSRDNFSSVTRTSASASRFLQAAVGESDMTIQAGVWAITDGYTRNMVQSRLRKPKSGRHAAETEMLMWLDQRHAAACGLSDPTEPAVSDDEIERAAALLNRLGISHRL